MAVHPGKWKHVDPRTMDPESARRLASGFWKHEHDMCNNIDTWICDKRKLHEAVQKELIDGRKSVRFSADPIGLLDARFGEGTGEAYRHAGQDRVAMRFDPLGGIRNMALGSGNTFTTSTTTASSSDMYWIDSSNSVRHPKERKTGKKYVAPSTKLVRNLPLVCGSGGLLDALQREFNYWAKPQMELLK